MSYQPPPGTLRITTLDLHTAGEPLRLITGGYPEIPGATMLEKRRYARRHHDDLRRALMFEPRGHADMYGCLPTPPVTAPEGIENGDTGVLFLHNEGYSTMCGHGIIALVKGGLESGLLSIREPDSEIRIDTPAGRVVARAHFAGSRVERVSFLNVPSFALERDLEVAVPGLGTVRYDLAFGGAFYAYVDAASVGLAVRPESYRRLIEAGTAIKKAVMDSHEIVHPEGDADLGFLYGTIFHEAGQEASGVHSRNVCIFADGEVDRSPTGTGVSGRAALLHARGELALGETIVIESLIGTRFAVRVAAETTVGGGTTGGRPAIVPEVTGTAHVTGRHEFFLDPDDPLREGVFLR